METGASYTVAPPMPQRRATDRMPLRPTVSIDLASRAASRLLTRLRSAHATMAVLVIHDDVYAPIFARLEAEIEAEEAKLNVGDPVAQARAIVAARRRNA